MLHDSSSKNIPDFWIRNCDVMVKAASDFAPVHLKSLDHVSSIVHVPSVMQPLLLDLPHEADLNIGKPTIT